MRQIIVLETRKGGDGITQVTGFFWFPIAAPAARVPKPQFVSLGAGLTGPAALAPAEITDLESGAVREEGFSIPYAVSTTQAQIKADLQRRYLDRVAAVGAEPPTRQFYGLSFDGTAWSA